MTISLPPLIMPTPDELRRSSLEWYGRVGPTMLDQLPLDVLALSMPTKFIRFPLEIIGSLYDREPWPSPVVDALAAELDAALGWDRHFIRLNSRSPKDAPWPFELPVTCSGKEAINILSASERALDDLAYFSHIPEHPAFICLRKFVPAMQIEDEYRCFVKDGELIAVSRYDYMTPRSAPADGGRAIRDRIDEWFREHLAPRLHIQTVVFDLFLPHDYSSLLYRTNDPLLIELNPYGLSDPCHLGSYEAVESFTGAVAFASPMKDDDWINAK